MSQILKNQDSEGSNVILAEKRLEKLKLTEYLQVGVLWAQEIEGWQYDCKM